MADILAVWNKYRVQTWAMLIQECKGSGMTNKDFSEQRGVSEKSFYYWQKKLHTQIVEAASPQLVHLKADCAPAELLQISFRGADLKLPIKVDIDNPSLYSIVMIDLSRVHNYYIACGYTDLRLASTV